MIDPIVTPSAAGASTASAAATSRTSSNTVSRGFEQVLVAQLAKEMLETAGDAGEKYASLLPNALAQGVQDAGGLGLDLDPPKVRS